MSGRAGVADRLLGTAGVRSEFEALLSVNHAGGPGSGPGPRTTVKNTEMTAPDPTSVIDDRIRQVLAGTADLR